jgi:hypothetical protein
MPILKGIFSKQEKHRKKNRLHLVHLYVGFMASVGALSKTKSTANGCAFS